MYDEETQKLFKELYEEHRDSMRIFEALIQLIHARKKGLAQSAAVLLAGLTRGQPGVLVQAATRQGLTPPHRAKIIAVIGDLDVPLKTPDAKVLVNHRRLKSRRAKEAVINLFDRLLAAKRSSAGNDSRTWLPRSGHEAYELLTEVRLKKVRLKNHRPKLAWKFNRSGFRRWAMRNLP